MSKCLNQFETCIGWEAAKKPHNPAARSVHCCYECTVHGEKLVNVQALSNLLNKAKFASENFHRMTINEFVALHAKIRPVVDRLDDRDFSWLSDHAEQSPSVLRYQMMFTDMIERCHQILTAQNVL